VRAACAWYLPKSSVTSCSLDNAARFPARATVADSRSALASLRSWSYSDSLAERDTCTLVSPFTSSALTSCASMSWSLNRKSFVARTLGASVPPTALICDRAPEARFDSTSAATTAKTPIAATLARSRFGVVPRGGCGMWVR